MPHPSLTKEQEQLFIVLLNQNQTFSYYLESLIFFLKHDLDTAILVTWWNKNAKTVAGENALDIFTIFLEQIHVDQDERPVALARNHTNLKLYQSSAEEKRRLPDTIEQLKEVLDKPRLDGTRFCSDFPQFRHVPWIRNLIPEFKNTFGTTKVLEHLAFVFSTYLPGLEDNKTVDIDDNLAIIESAYVVVNSPTHDHLLTLADWVAKRKAGVYWEELLDILRFLLKIGTASKILDTDLYFRDWLNQRLFDLFMATLVQELIVLNDSSFIDNVLWHFTSFNGNLYRQNSLIVTDKNFESLFRLLVNNHSINLVNFEWASFFSLYARFLSGGVLGKVRIGSGDLFQRALNSEDMPCEDPDAITNALKYLKPPVGCVLDYLNKYCLHKLSLNSWRLHDPDWSASQQDNELSDAQYNHHEDIKRFCKIWFPLCEYIEQNGDARSACVLRIFAFLILYCYSRNLRLVHKQIDANEDDKNHLFNPWYFKQKDDLQRLAEGDLSICRYRFGD